MFLRIIETTLNYTKVKFLVLISLHINVKISNILFITFFIVFAMISHTKAVLLNFTVFRWKTIKNYHRRRTILHGHSRYIYLMTAFIWHYWEVVWNWWISDHIFWNIIFCVNRDFEFYIYWKCKMIKIWRQFSCLQTQYYVLNFDTRA